MSCGKSIEVVDGVYNVRRNLNIIVLLFNFVPQILNPMTPATTRDVRAICDAFGGTIV
jgi:hypothetical protein